MIPCQRCRDGVAHTFEHGTHSAYVSHGCRCAECSAAAAEYRRAYKNGTQWDSERPRTSPGGRRRGPKAPVDSSPLPFDLTGDDVADFEKFCSEFVRLERGTQMVLQPFQREIVEMLWGGVRPKLSALSIGRGNAKSTLCSAICLFLIFTRSEWIVEIYAVDESQSSIIGQMAANIVSRHPELESRCQVFKDHLVVGSSELWWLPATPASAEGHLADFAVIDEAGRVSRDLYEVVAQSNSKKPWAQLFLIGTPGPDPENVLATYREQALAGDDPHQAYMEFSANEWRDHPVNCDDHGDGLGSGCLSAANPGLGVWLTRESLLSALPPKITEQSWRRTRLIQFWATGADEPFIPRDIWENLGTGKPIPAGTQCVLAVDGAFGGARADTFALLLGTVSPKPVFQKLKVWETDGTPGWRVDLFEVEEEIRAASKRWNIVEVVADPFRLNRTLQVLQQDGFTVSEFPWSPSRVTKATTDVYSAAVNGNFSYVPDDTFTNHVMNATVQESPDGGIRIGKASRKKSAGHVDLCACLVMNFSRCVWLGTRPKKRARIVGA